MLFKYWNPSWTLERTFGVFDFEEELTSWAHHFDLMEDAATEIESHIVEDIEFS